MRSHYRIGLVGPFGSPVFACAGKTDPPSSSHPLADLGGYAQHVRFAPMSGLPSHLGVSSDLRLLIVVPAVADVEVDFEFRYREMLPLLGLPQERPALKGTEGRRLTVQ
jgi:hypothetical protein